MSDAPSAPPLCDQLLVDFPTRRRPTVRFASTDTVFPVRSTLTMIRHNEELWYSVRDVEMMKIERNLDATTLRKMLHTPSTEDFKQARVHGCQAVGLEKALDPTQARKRGMVFLNHRMAIVELQELTDDDGICRISERFSSWSSELAHSLAKAAWESLDK